MSWRDHLHVFVDKLVQSDVLQHSPTISGWFVQAVRQRISNGAPAQSASLLQSFVQYICPEPTHGVARWVVPQIASTASPLREAERIGSFLFELDGTECRLAVTRLLEPGVPDDHFDVYFRDATTGRESYDVGRYASVERIGDEATVDFNLAYNPSCALSPFYNCPIPPAENRLSVPIRAGEMSPLADLAH